MSEEINKPMDPISAVNEAFQRGLDLGRGEQQAKADALVAALEAMTAAFRAFRSKPVGGPGSEARLMQEAQIAAEDAARAALTAAQAKE